ncbi:MAG: MoaD/ThiS family protein [Thermoplasmatota archaeon]
MKVKLYGDLREYADRLDEQSTSIGLLDIDLKNLNTVSDLLKYLGIDSTEVSHIFVNREYSALERRVSDDDRVALFPKDMGLLYKWYFSKKK